ncbi:MAG: hypothetical protein OXH00_06695 [Candidatus Poribacteria bacterium]|nr:hypothetical protein [Candidatus Poribacteria bacterium]
MPNARAVEALESHRVYATFSSSPFNPTYALESNSLFVKKKVIF